MFDLLGAFQQMGMRLPAKQELPDIVYHSLQSRYSGETLQEACLRASHYFGARPKLIFVLLPDTGNVFVPCSGHMRQIHCF